MSQSLARAAHEQTESPLDIRIGALDTLLDHAAHVQHPTDLVITPVELHRRHLKQRLSSADQPLSAFEFTGGGTVAARLLEPTNEPTRSLDRVDRLDLLEAILAREDGPREYFEILLGGEPTTKVRAVEQTRSEIEAITNYHPTRVRAYRHMLATLADSIAADARDALYGALAVEGALRYHAAKPPTETELLRRATRQLGQADTDVWQAAYPHVERVGIAGLSNVSAPLIDLLTAIARSTSVGATIYLRAATGPYLHDRLPHTLVETLGDVYIE
ncbi:MAG: hypothetical protein ACOCTH_00340 [Halodesulfurarchaeum sp.]